MSDYATVKLYGGPRCNYELVWFEERGEWFIRSTDRASQEQAYSESGYETKQDAARAFEGRITYVAEAPGQL